MNFYEILKTKKLGRGSPDQWTQLFAEHVGGKGEWKVAGVLPLTFTAKGGTAADWAIYGNDEPGENLFDKNARDTENGYVEAFYIRPDNNIFSNNSFIVSEYIPVEPNSDYYLSKVVTYGTSTGLCFYDENKTYISGVRLYAGGELTTNITTPNNCRYIRTSIQVSQSVLEESMIIKGSTPPDHYIPYQIGVGERTEQLMNCSTISGGVLNEYGVVVGVDATTNIHADNGNISFTTGSAWRGIVTDFTEIKSDVENVTLTYSGDRATSWRLCFYDNSQIFISQSSDIDRQTRVVAIPNNAKYFRASAQFETAGTYSLTLLSIAKGSTPPDHYIPYGYQIPLTVSQQGQTDKNYDIYIGDTPLTEGETVSKTSTGVDIELFEGENTVSTTLYNKPTMEIKYK